MVIQHSIKSKLNYKSVNKAFCGLFGISGIGALLVLPLISISSASAESLDYNVNIGTSLNVTVSTDTVSLTLNPSTTPFASTDLDVAVGTNNPWGYSLYLQADTTDLTNSTYSDDVYINTLTGTATGTASAFPTNRWGYRVSELSSGNTADSSITDTTGTYFYPFVSNTLIGSAASAVNNSTSTLTFASKVDYEKPAGVYTLDFNFRTVPTVTTLNMQNLDPTVCTTDPTLVTDSRDGQMYAIARLADGKCWMLQNLKLGSKTATMTLSGSDTNIAVNGSFELTNRLADGKFPRNTISEDPVTGQPSYYYDSQAYYCTDNYGCYYNNYTATAGSMTSSTGAGTTVNYSICPKGWSLPTGGSGGEFETLATAYGYGTDSGSTVAGKLLVANPSTVTENINGQYTPGLLLSGVYNSGGADHLGALGLYWSRTSYSTGRAYNLYLLTSGVYPLNHSYKYNGFAVRCLLQ